ncbi:MAG: NDP-sugar synthase [Myxococcales bacterium]|nr:NDP-sugar synthase [Myxococcales bacterium]
MSGHGLRAGIIAAGWGERLRTNGSDYRMPKALPEAGGRPLIEHVLGSLRDANPEEVVVIVNEASGAVKDYVSGLDTPFPIRWITKTTPSSMHSFLHVLEALANAGPGPFLISTVDTISSMGTFSAFARRASAIDDADVVLALTDHIDDEKPLMADLRGDDLDVGRHGANADYRILALGEKSDIQSCYATAGYYWVHPRVLREANRIRSQEQPALRKFFGHLQDEGYRLYGLPMPDSVDVDRPQDVEAAERLLRQEA